MLEIGQENPWTAGWRLWEPDGKDLAAGDIGDIGRYFEAERRVRGAVTPYARAVEELVCCDGNFSPLVDEAQAAALASLAREPYTDRRSVSFCTRDVPDAENPAYLLKLSKTAYLYDRALWRSEYALEGSLSDNLLPQHVRINIFRARNGCEKVTSLSFLILPTEGRWVGGNSVEDYTVLPSLSGIRSVEPVVAADGDPEDLSTYGLQFAFGKVIANYWFLGDFGEGPLEGASLWMYLGDATIAETDEPAEE